MDRQKRFCALLAFTLPFLLLLPKAHPNPSTQPLPPGVYADKIVVEKAKRKLSLYSKGRLLKQYSIALGKNPVGPKCQEGDGKTPEGFYLIDGRNPHSSYHLSLRISYPNIFDVLRARELGVAPGGGIEIHGMKNGYGWIGAGHRHVDWTKGCIAVTNEEIEELWRVVPDGTVIEIRP